MNNNYIASAEAMAAAYVPRTGTIVTASASFTASSSISMAEAHQLAQDGAVLLAQQTAQYDADLLNQSSTDTINTIEKEGITGLTGITGTVSGTTGPTGKKGDPGGPTGYTGTTGMTGVLGKTGVQGITGNTGSAGPAGGFTGNTGPTGIGSTGPTGSSSFIVGYGPTGYTTAAGVTSYPNITTIIFDSNTNFSVSKDETTTAFVTITSSFPRDTLPSVSYGTVTSEETDIYIPINFPSQEYYGFNAAPFPVVAGSKFVLTTQSGNTAVILDTSTDSSVGSFNSKYVRPLAFGNTYPGTGNPGNVNIARYTGLQGIILSNSSSPNSQSPVPSVNSFPGSNNYYSIIYNITSSALGSSGSIGGYYYDYAGFTGPSVVTFSGYRVGTAPSSDAYYGSSSSITYRSFVIVVYGPSTTTTPANPNVGLADCIASYIASASTIRYGTTYTPPPNNNISTGLSEKPYTTIPSKNYTFTSLSPDCTYTLNIYSKNTVGQSSITTWPSGSGSSTHTQPVITTVFPDVVNIPSNYNVSYIGNIISTAFINAYTVSSDTLVSTLINNSAITTNNLLGSSYGIMWAKDGNYTPPNTSNMYIGTFATSSTLLMELVATIGSTTYATLNYYGFGAATNPTVSLSGATQTGTPTVVDQYSSGAGYDGFYTKTSGSIELTVSSLTAQQAAYTMAVTQTYYSAGSGSTNYLKSESFYYDSIVGAPALTPGSSSFSLSSATATQISGINVYGTGSFIFSATTAWTNLADYFYPANPVSYTFSSGVSGTIYETNLNNGTQTSGTKDWSITNPSLSATPIRTFGAYQPALNVVGTNIVSSSASSSSASASPVGSKFILYDYPSISIISTTPSTIQPLTSIGVITNGCRVWSNICTVAPFVPSGYTEPTYIPPNFSYNTYAYAQILYQQAWSIINTNTSSSFGSLNTSEEIQVFNGSYRSATAAGSNYSGYSNYSSGCYNNNSLNYSTVPFGNLNYRFSTFAWLYPGTYTSNYTRYVFILKNFRVNGSNISTSDFAIDSATNAYYVNVSANTQRFFVNYKTDQLNGNSTITTVPASGVAATCWVDANCGYQTTSSGYGSNISISAANYTSSGAQNNTLVYPPSSFLFEISDTDLQITTSSLNFASLSNKYYVYFRIGFPMGTSLTYSFDSVDMQILS